MVLQPVWYLHVPFWSTGKALDGIGRQKRMLVVGAEDCNFQSIVPFCGMRVFLGTDPNQASARLTANAMDLLVPVDLLVLETSTANRRGSQPYAKFIG